MGKARGMLAPPRRLAQAAGLACALGLLPAARADEGAIPPDQLPTAVDPALRERGFALSAEDLWTDSGGLLRAAVRLGGCSASFVSEDGLIATNHHCAYGAIQRLSSVEHDFLAEGFLARERGEERSDGATTVRVLERIEDVSDRFDALFERHDDPAALARAYDELRRTLVEECEKGRPGHRCQVAAFFGGRVHRRFDYLELRDVRLVFAPPSAIGEYGGEIDNWMWPRHTGDFSLFRAYVGPDGAPADPSDENVPYRPAHHLTVDPEGVAPGDVVAVLGYPGRTRRHLPLAEVERYRDQVYPLREAFYARLLDVLHAHAERDRAVALALASRIKGLENRRKNARGTLEGFRRDRIVERRRPVEARVAELARARGPAYTEALETLDALSAEARKDFPARFLADHAATVSTLVGVALSILRHAERAKEEPPADPAEAARRRDDLVRSIERRLAGFDPEVEEDMLEAWFSFLATTEGADGVVPARLRSARRIARGSRLRDPKVAAALADAPEDALRRNPDPALAVARSLLAYERARRADDERRRGLRLRALPRYVELLEAATDGPFYPDANRTLRVSFATVRGYDPEDGLRALPQTTLSGALAKHRDAPPFDLPDAVLAAAGSAPDTYWADPVLKDLPLCFLTDADTTGGNSGSAVVDGQGRLVGLNFDRVWHNVVGDFLYDDSRSRNIVVDVRYLLWLLDDVYGATALLEELGVAQLAEAGRRPAPRSGTADATATDGANGARPAVGADAARAGAGCGCNEGPAAPGLPLLALLTVLPFRCRRLRSRPPSPWT